MDMPRGGSRARLAIVSLLACTFATRALPALAEGVPETVERVGKAIEREIAGKRKVWAYTDDRGRLVHVERSEQVPQHLQPYAREVDAPPGYFDDDEEAPLLDGELFNFGEDEAKTDLDTIYKIELPDGRIVYTNLAERVAPERREKAKVDLSHISLNTELGNEIDKRIKAEHEKLVGSKYCKELRDDVSAPIVERLWRDERPLVICMGVVLLLLLITPSMVRRVGGPAWGRTLMMAIPSLIIAGLVMFAMMKANSALSSLKSKAEPCEEKTWDKLAQKPETAVRDHLNLVQQLKDQIAEIDKLTREGR